MASLQCRNKKIRFPAIPVQSGQFGESQRNRGRCRGASPSQAWILAVANVGDVTPNEPLQLTVEIASPFATANAPSISAEAELWC